MSATHSFEMFKLTILAGTYIRCTLKNCIELNTIQQENFLFANNCCSEGIKHKKRNFYDVYNA